MGKVKKQKKFRSIKLTFLFYLPVCALLSFLGAYGIGIATNGLQEWYERNYSEEDFQEQLLMTYEKIEEMHQAGIVQEIEADGEDVIVGYEIWMGPDGTIYYDIYSTDRFVSDKPWLNLIYSVISYSQVILIPAWVLLCVFVTGVLFYKRELEHPIRVLMDASLKISENCLEFQMPETKQNELGQLCRSFEDMRQALYKNNQELWRTLEERKRLNAAFSHDIRTPLAVLKGYQELLENYVPEDKFSKEQMLEMVDTMGGQIVRLENYTRKMSEIQKLEDIVPEPKETDWKELVGQCKEAAELLAGTLELHFSEEEIVSRENVNSEMPVLLRIDRELVMEVYENLLSNAVRFAKKEIKVTLFYGCPNREDNTKTILSILIEDDGQAFSEEALWRGTAPFYGSEKDGKVHFGLGLYICKVICEKHGGNVILENGSSGGKVTAIFSEI